MLDLVYNFEKLVPYFLMSLLKVVSLKVAAIM